MRRTTIFFGEIQETMLMVPPLNGYYHRQEPPSPSRLDCSSLMVFEHFKELNIIFGTIICTKVAIYLYLCILLKEQRF